MTAHRKSVNASIIIGLIGLVVCYFLIGGQSVTKVHKLKYPLILSSDTGDVNHHLLPVGTVLYYDKAFPEGFTRYRIYVNVDRMPLELESLDDPTSIQPIEASAPGKEDLSRLLREYPLSKNELRSILKSGAVSQEEIRQLLEEFSQNK